MAISRNGKTPNRLINEKSPYLLQHAYNPVDWFPWGEEAFKKAEIEGKPIFLSIGYSTCHWCHVMERESFEDEEVAAFLNECFVSIKVDREERPDIDSIYMSYCQALTGSGGWPLSIFMTPDKKPFFAGTYFPKIDRINIRGFIPLLERIRKAWADNRENILQYSNQVIESLTGPHKAQAQFNEDESIDDMAEDSYSYFLSSFDETYGGFGEAPKFPTPHNLFFLLRYWYKTKEEKALQIVEKTLDSMYRGGIFDHIGFGFSRYSTDSKWLVPHFEKMLYDNALLAIAYLETYRATQKTKYADIARNIFTYVIRDMTSPEGGFYSAEDADSEGEEGKFYVWTVDEIKSVLGETDGLKYCSLFDVTEAGNFEGANIPNLIKADIPEHEKGFVQQCREKLFAYREKRVHPFKDDKLLTSWNSLMIAAMAIGGRILGDSQYTRTAERAVQFILTRMVNANDRLLARYRDGEASISGYVDDYAFFVWSLIELYETTYKPEYLKLAIKFNNELINHFMDQANDGLFLYANDAEQLIIRPKEIYDGAIPSGNSVAAMNFIRLSRLTGNSELEEFAQRQFKAFIATVANAPYAYSFYMSSLLYSAVKTKEVIITGDSEDEKTKEMIKCVQSTPNPFINSILYTDKYGELKNIITYIENYKTIDDKATAYVCEGFSCKPPITDASLLGASIS